MILRIDDHALTEMEEALGWYQNRSESAAESFRRALSDAMDRVESSPARLSPYLFNTRRMLLTPFPYLLVFVIERDRIFIVALAHAKRKPGYWKTRLKAH